MSRPRASRNRGPLLSMVSLALSVVFVLAPTSLLAQDESSAPSEAAASAVPAESTAPTGDAVELLPAEIAGVPIDPENIVVFRGQEIIEMNPAGAEQFQAVADATGTSIDDMVQVSAYVEPAEGDVVLLGAVQFVGADAREVLEVLLPLSFEAMQEPRVETMEIGGRQVTVLYEDASEATSPTNLIAIGDIIWIVQGDEQYITGVIEQLPG